MIKILLLLALLGLSACSKNPLNAFSDINDGAPQHVPVNIAAIPDATPRYEPYSPAVNPKFYEVLGKRYYILASSKNYVKQGIASWYGTKFHGKKTANGEKYDMFAMTAAHKTLPIPSYVRVTNIQNQRSVVVRINDRGPFHENRIIDLSYAAAVKLDIQKSGTGFVEVRALEPGNTVANKTPAALKNTIFLQVGAFSSQFNALALQKRIQANMPVNARIQAANHQGNAIFKLQLGPINSVTQADHINAQLAKLGIMGTHFVIEKSGANLHMVQ